MSLVEALVAAALLGITAVAALTAWNTALLAAREATHQAWARCLARSEMGAVLAAPWSQSYSAADPSVRVSVAPGPLTGVQRVTVNVGPQGAPTYSLTALKAAQLGGAAAPDTSPISRGCPPP